MPTNDFQYLIILIIKQISFKIEKLYLDCIDDQGNCFILYWAKVEFFLMRFVYSGLVFCNAKGFTTEKSTLHKTNKPVIDRIIQFNHKLLKTNIKFNRTDDAIIRLLYKDSNNNELIWNCHHPKGWAEIIHNDSIYKGFGYAETLISQIKPWNLPIDELKWGRFLSDFYTVIWINWLGKYPINKIFINGIEFNDAIFKDDIISFNNDTYRLKFSEIQLIREGKLSGLFSRMTLLKMFLNRRILNTIEIKYKSRTSFSKNSELLSNGWSIFEIVPWGR